MVLLLWLSHELLITPKRMTVEKLITVNHDYIRLCESSEWAPRSRLVSGLHVPRKNIHVLWNSRHWNELFCVFHFQRATKNTVALAEQQPRGCHKSWTVLSKASKTRRIQRRYVFWYNINIYISLLQVKPLTTRNLLYYSLIIKRVRVEIIGG